MLIVFFTPKLLKGTFKSLWVSPTLSGCNPTALSLPISARILAPAKKKYGPGKTEMICQIISDMASQPLFETRRLVSKQHNQMVALMLDIPYLSFEVNRYSSLTSFDPSLFFLAEYTQQGTRNCRPTFLNLPNPGYTMGYNSDHLC